MYPRRLVTVLTVTSLTALAGCSAADSPTSDSMTVPVLWAGTDAEGNPAAGVEDAGISVSDDGEPGFTVDLSGSQAQGAGPSWQTASAMAATVGTLFSSVDPEHVSVRFSVTGPIDGPSGGTALAVGVLASLRNESLKPGVTMTGTLAPDGTVGIVSSIPEKIRAAATAGYRTVLVPMVALGRAGTRHYESPESAARASNVKLIGVRDIGEAYAEFTGSSIEPAVAPFTPSAAMTAVQRGLASKLISKTRSGLSTGEVSATARARIETGLAEATQSLGVDPAEAYGIAADSYRLLREATAQPQSQKQLLARSRELLAECTAKLNRDASITGLASNQQLSLPSALGMLSHKSATLEALNDDLGKPTTDAAFTRSAAVVLTQQRAIVEVFYPDQLTIIRALTQSQASGASAAAFMSGYTNFLVAAGKANEEYIATRGRGEDSTRVAGEWGNTVKLLGAHAQTIPVDQQGIADEARQSAEALAYYLASAWQVSAEQAFRLNQLGNVAMSADSTKALRNSATTADETVSAFASELAAGDVDASYADWLAGVGVGATSSAIKRGALPADIAQALGSSWAGTTNVLMLAAAP